MHKVIDHIGMWTWGGRVYNWKKYLDNMHVTGMDTVVLWHYHVPADAADIQEYAHGLGIKVIWGFNWSWNSPVCLNSDEDAQKWQRIVLDTIENEYAPLNPDGICFQVGGTELDSKCRLDCDVCRDAYRTGVGPLYVKFAGSIMDAVKAEYPDLYLCANLHLGGVHQSYDALKAIDPSANIMWEDLPGPGWRIEVPFAYDWDPGKSAVTPETLDMVRQMCELRGEDEDVAFIVKGFPAYWGGADPMLLPDLDLKALSTVFLDKWKDAERYCEKRLEDALKVFRIIAESPARKKTVLMLVEHGLWEYRRYYPAVLIADAISNPFREPEEIIRKVRAVQTGNIE